MEQKKTLLIIVAIFVLLLAVAYPLYNRLSREASLDQVATLPQQNTATETKPTESAPTGTQPETTQPTQPDETQSAGHIQNFTAYDENGKQVTLTDYIGKPVVLNFWASWCGPCKSEMPEFQEVYEEMGQQIQFLMVNDTVSDKMEDAKAFIQENGYTFPVLFDTKGEALTVYGVDAFPTTFFLDATGTPVAYAVGAISKDSLLKGIDMID